MPSRRETIAVALGCLLGLLLPFPVLERLAPAAREVKIVCDNEHPDYTLPPVPDECGPTETLNQTCVNEHKAKFCNDVDDLRNTRADHDRTARRLVGEAIAAACNGDAGCITALKAAGFDTLTQNAQDYDDGLQTLRDTFGPSITADCCISSTPPGGGGQ